VPHALYYCLAGIFITPCPADDRYVFFSRIVESFLPRVALCHEMNSHVWSQSAVILVPSRSARPPQCLLQVNNTQFTSYMEPGQFSRYTGWATGWKPRNGSSIPSRTKRFIYFPKHPDRLWCPSSFVFSRYRELVL